MYMLEEISACDQAIKSQRSSVGLNYYSPTVFKSIGATGTNTSLLTIGIFGIIKTVMTFV